MGDGGYRYSVRRNRRKLFVGRDHYLDDQTGRLVNDPKLCQAMEATLQPSLRNPDLDPPELSGWEGFPWMTLVLGSGCLDLPEAAGHTAEQFAEKVRQRLEAVGPKQLDVAHIDLAASFAESLVRDRIEARAAGSGDQVVAGPDAETVVAANDVAVDMESTVSPNQEGAPGNGFTEVKVGEVAARVVLAAALLTRYYHRTRSLSPIAISRWDDDVASLDCRQERMQTGAEAILKEDLAPAQRELVWVKEHLSETGEVRELLRAVSALLDAILGGLRQPDGADIRQLRLDHLRLLTEVSWYFVLGKTPLYPGWTDLLIKLMLGEGVTDSTSMRSRPRNLDLVKLGPAVRALLEAPTKASWRGGPGFGLAAAQRDRFYRSVGVVLQAQAEAVRERERDSIQGQRLVRQGNAALKDPALTDEEERAAEAQIAEGQGLIDQTMTTLPPASAFVTSFDLELEMALWKQTMQPFAVVLPVHVVVRDSAERGREAELCWLLAQIDPAAESDPHKHLAALRKPTSWRLLTSATEASTLREQPVVVHLSGCPMLELPKLPAAGADPVSEAQSVLVDDLSAVGIVAAGRQLAHAVTVDEYLALRQAEAELYWLIDKRHPSRGLHQALTSDGSQNPRFWMAMGVPIADPAVRHRVVSQITQRMLRDASDHQSVPEALPDADASEAIVGSRGAVDGLSVNKRISDNEASLLYWVGLDVVQDNCSQFTESLLHYAAHVRAPVEAKRPPVEEPCELATPSLPATSRAHEEGQS